MTAMRSARRFVTALSVAVSTVLTACGGSEGGPVSPVVVPPPAPTVVSISMDCGDTTLVEGTTRQCSALATLSDGSTRDVTFNTDAKWSSTGSVAVLIGRIQAMTPGIGQVSVAYNGKVVTVTVTVKPDGTPWSELPHLSEEGKAYVKLNLLGTSGRVMRWADSVHRIWIDPVFSVEKREGAVAFWRAVYKGKRSFVLVSDSVTANMWVFNDPSIVDPNVCGYGGPALIMNYVILAGVGRANGGRPECNSSKLLAHEIGHMLGFVAHTPSKMDVMSSPNHSLIVSPLLLEFAVWYYMVSPGTKPI